MTQRQLIINALQRHRLLPDGTCSCGAVVIRPQVIRNTPHDEREQRMQELADIHLSGAILREAL